MIRNMSAPLAMLIESDALTTTTAVETTTEATTTTQITTNAGIYNYNIKIQAK